MRVLDVVATLREFPDQRVGKGQVGTVVDELDHDHVLVEFSDQVLVQGQQGGAGDSDTDCGQQRDLASVRLLHLAWFQAIEAQKQSVAAKQGVFEELFGVRPNVILQILD